MLRYLTLLLPVLLSACKPKEAPVFTASSGKAERVILLLCEKVSDSAEGEVWKEVSRVATVRDGTVDEILAYKSHRKDAGTPTVPLCPYKDLIVCLDGNQLPLFAIAEKACLDCVRISDVRVEGDGIVKIGGDDHFDGLVYVNDSKLSKTLRDKKD